MFSWNQAKLAATLATVGPWLYIQGRQTRQAIPKLPECFHPQGKIPGLEPAVHLVFIGDSIMAGVGHQDPEGILPVQLAKVLVEKSGRAVSWTNLAYNGASSTTLLQKLPTSLPPADLYLVSVGVNDALRLCSPESYAKNLHSLSQSQLQVPWLLVGLPNLRQFPSLPYPLRDFLAWRVAQLEAAALQLPAPWQVHIMRQHLTLDTFSPDGFHPGEIGCRYWAKNLLPQVFDLLQIKPKRLELRLL